MVIEAVAAGARAWECLRVTELLLPWCVGCSHFIASERKGVCLHPLHQTILILSFLSFNYSLCIVHKILNIFFPIRFYAALILIFSASKDLQLKFSDCGFVFKILVLSSSSLPPTQQDSLSAETVMSSSLVISFFAESFKFLIIEDIKKIHISVFCGMLIFYTKYLV